MIGNIYNWVGLHGSLGQIVALAALWVVAAGAFWLIGIVRWSLRKGTFSTEQPTVSVIISARNETKLIRNCLESLLNQTYPAQLLTVCLVDDHSTDDTLRVAGDMAALHPGRIQVLSAPPCPSSLGPKKSALLYGIQHTHGNVLLFTDADCVVPSGWVEAMVRQLGPETEALTGAMLPAKCVNLGDRLFWLERFSVSLATASAIGWGSPASATGGNLAYRRQTFLQIGGFAHPELPAGDDDLTIQAIAAQGLRVNFARGSESAVSDSRIPSLQQVAHASARHQSTMKFYPLHWRLAYAASIASGAAALLCLIAMLTTPSLWPVVAACFAFRALLDFIMVRLFVRQIGEQISLLDFTTAEFLLPVYSVFRPLLKLMPGFAWRGRVHAATVRGAAPTLSQQSGVSG
ncbi:MAG: glycosyltransferase [bacterium]|nr:glycosyltransferase [bacterium]